MDHSRLLARDSLHINPALVGEVDKNISGQHTTAINSYSMLPACLLPFLRLLLLHHVFDKRTGCETV